MPNNLVRLSLRPYPGDLYLAKTTEAYEKACLRLFSRDDKIEGTGRVGRFMGGNSAQGKLTYLIWAEGTPQLAHELSHVLFDLFGLVGINPSDSLGEPFCYMLSQLLLDAANA
jgi:hypothetical protein